MRVIAAVVALGLASPALPLAQDGYGKTQGLLPGVLIAPKLNLIALPPGGGLEVRTLGNQLGLSFDFGIVPMTKVGTMAKIGWNDFSLGAKWYPWAARFYLGARGGVRSFDAKGRDDATGLEAKASVKSTYLAPELGWHFTWESGFFLAVELGYQLILSKSSTFTFPAGIDQGTQSDVQDAADLVGKVGLPVLTLLQLGYYF